MFGDLDWPLNASRSLSAIAEFLVFLVAQIMTSTSKRSCDTHYRATLVFAVARCPSVRLSVTFMHFIHMAEDIVKLLCRPGSPIILVFDTSGGTQFQGEPFSGGAKYNGWENFAIFDWNRRLSRKLYEKGPWLPCNVNRKSLCALSNGDIFNDFGGPLSRFSRSRHFWSRITYKRYGQSYYRTLIGNHTYHMEW